MRQLVGPLAVGVGLAASAAQAAPAVEIRNAVVRVVVSPEARSDISIDVVRANPRLPLRIWRYAGRTYVDGGLAHRIRSCAKRDGQPGFEVAGIGETSL